MNHSVDCAGMDGMAAGVPDAVDGDTSVEDRARFAAFQLCRGFVEHDRRNRTAAVEAFAAVDRQQFEHRSDSEAADAAAAYVEALWRKDAIEDECRVAGEIDPDAVAAADWGPVEAAFRERARIVGIDEAYAPLSTRGWLQHKAGGDYWTPLMRAQQHELRAAMQTAYPDKPRSGTSGFGPGPSRYLVGVELHDLRRLARARTVMEPYFERIFLEHDR